MNGNGNTFAQVDNEGRLVLPPETSARYNIRPGSRISIDEDALGLHVNMPTRLARLYIELTNQCNLDCVTCIRNVWDEPPGMMSDAVFSRIVEGLKAVKPTPTVFFGGFGEPLLHPSIIDMIKQVKALGTQVELITNATMLTADMSRDLITAGLDTLWVSLDGASPESYADVRLGAELPSVISNIRRFQALCAELREKGWTTVDEFTRATSVNTKLGIEFVAMKRNIDDLPALLDLAHDLDAAYFLISNLLPYTQEMCNETIYYDIPNNLRHQPLLRELGNPLHALRQNGMSITIAGTDQPGDYNRCPFIEKGSGALGWDGGFSPCLPLLHSHSNFVLGRERFSRKWSIGNIKERSLSDLWHDAGHEAFREGVRTFDFSPCSTCGGCHLSETNEEDCVGNTFPTCGGCLWAQSLIRCP